MGSGCSLQKRMCPLYRAVSRELLPRCRHSKSFRGLRRSSWLLETRCSLHQQQTIGLAGRRSRKASNLRSVIFPQDEVAKTQLIDGAVMLSEAKHLCLSSSVDRARFDQRFFTSLRMTL